MNPAHATKTTQFKVGIFTFLGLALIGGITVYVNHRPFWWRPCQLVKISVEDATGLKTKSPIRSLGLEIGFLKSVDLTETHVSLGICITAQVEVLPTTRAYIRGEGFLGDKFVELKPVKYVGTNEDGSSTANNQAPPTETPAVAPSNVESPSATHSEIFSLIHSAYADEIERNLAVPPSSVPVIGGEAPASARVTRGANGEREIPVGKNSQDIQQLVNRVDGLVSEMTGLTKNLKEGFNPEEMRQTMRQLNKTLENAARTLSPEGGLNQTAQRTLAKLEDSIEQLRDMMTRVNKGEGSVGMLINDPSYANQIKEALVNLNHLLNKAGSFRLVVDFGAEELGAYSGGRGFFRLGVWPTADRYYLLGISVDPRGSLTVTKTTTTAGGAQTQTESDVLSANAFQFTAMLGKTFFRGRLDTSMGVLHGDGTLSAMLNLGPSDRVDLFSIRDDLYSRTNNQGVADRVTAFIHPLHIFPAVYLKAGVEDFRQVNGKTDYSYGAGVTFDDEDIKFLLSLK